ncbi:MAG TPA: prepilin-type N-terminal cleavage/methylation domain-containing protein [Steroidobacteraceae bacterium]
MRTGETQRSRTAHPRGAGFTLIEILVVVLIIGIISAGVLLSVNLTGRDHELEHESDRLLSLVNYAREQAELQTREYGVVFHDDGYQFVTYDTRRGVWRKIYEDDALRLRRLPPGLQFALIVEARPVVLIPTGDVKSDPKANAKPAAKSVKDLTSLQDATSPAAGAAGASPTSRAGTVGSTSDSSTSLSDAKPVIPQVMIFSNGDLTSFEVTLQREDGVRSVTLAQDAKGQVVARPMVERKS